ncbi:MAG: hypothetical protein FWC16_00665 [Defluviitaleaceae bacterium]|nr:hypothetical protein [Defluviitaleaceae bacterium]MCL2273416.1 hypothetical protein [Defluviitaleaceae bacterium]
MKKIKTLKGWGVFKNNAKETQEHGFKITVLHPDNMEYAYLCSPHDTDMELETLESAVSWIESHGKAVTA